MARPCELRRQCGERIVCGAGGFVLGTVGGDMTDLEATCGACPIPERVATDPAACLHLRPIRVAREDGGLDSYFSCRFFYRLHLRRQPQDLSRCRGCPYWFPRPPVALIEPLGYWEETDAIRTAVADPATVAPEAPGGTFAPATAPAPPPPWRRLLARLRPRRADGRRPAAAADQGERPG
jgi:hypothetical protein